MASSSSSSSSKYEPLSETEQDEMFSHIAAKRSRREEQADEAAAALAEVVRCQREYMRTHGSLGRHFAAAAADPMLRADSHCEYGLCQGIRLDVRRRRRVGGGGGDAEHYCSDFCVRHHGVAAGEPLGEARFFFCARHARVHLCQGACAFTAYTDTLGARVCVLSGRQIAGAALQNSFGDGTLPDTLQQQQQPPRAPSSKRRVGPAGSASEVLRRTAIGAGVARQLDDGGAVDDEDDDGEFDPDYPRAGLFSDELESNGFGDGCGAALDETYLQAYGSVHHLLFSEARQREERHKVGKASADAWRAVTGYVRDCVRAGAPVSLQRCVALHARALNAVHVYDAVLLAPGATRRITAALAWQLLEMHLNLAELADRVAAAAAAAAATTADRPAAKQAALRKAVGRVRGFSLADLFPTLLDRLRQEPGGWLLELMYPEPHTIARMGIAQHTCTEVGKQVNLLLAAARSLGLAPPRPGTRLDHQPLLTTAAGAGGAGGSVLALFVRQRVKSLQQQQ